MICMTISKIKTQSAEDVEQLCGKELGILLSLFSFFEKEKVNLNFPNFAHVTFRHYTNPRVLSLRLLAKCIYSGVIISTLG